MHSVAAGARGGYSFKYGLGMPPGGPTPQLIALAGDVRVPLLPLYFGFTINTLFYAAIVYGLWSVFGAAIAWRRLSRGKCPNCKYAIGPSPVCTECGTKIPGR